MSESLVDVCEPLLQHLCRINRLGRRGGQADASQARAEIKALIADAGARAASSPTLADAFARVRPALLVLADWVVTTSRLPWARTWPGLASEEGVPDADRVVFDLIDGALAEQGDGATQRLGVLYQCVGLGYPGPFAGQPDALRRKMAEVSARIRGMLDADENARVTPDAYENVDTSQLTLPAAGTIARPVILLVGLALVVVAAVWIGSRQAGRKLEEALSGIVAEGAGAAK